MWTNTFFGGAGLGVFDFDDAIVTPYVGGSYAINDYLEDNLDILKLTIIQPLHMHCSSHNTQADGQVV